MRKEIEIVVRKLEEARQEIKDTFPQPYVGNSLAAVVFGQISTEIYHYGIINQWAEDHNGECPSGTWDEYRKVEEKLGAVFSEQ